MQLSQKYNFAEFLKHCMFGVCINSQKQSIMTYGLRLEMYKYDANTGIGSRWD